MKRIALFSLCFVITCGIGWYFGHTRPTIQKQRYEREALRKYLEEAEQESRMATAVALRAIYILDRGEVENAKHFLGETVGDYYRHYRDKGGNTNMIANIEKAAARYPVIAAEISKKPE